MSGGGSWTRRGEWLEAMPGRVITAAADPASAVDRYLLDTVGMPAKLHARLSREGGIQWKGGRLRLALFPYREAGLEPVWQEAKVLFEDDFCLVVHKPAGMAVHPDGSGSEVTLDHVVAAHYAASGGGVAVRHIHRLDKDTTGPVLYAKNEYAQLALDEAMRAKAVSRLYAAIVQGIVPPELKVIDAPIGRDRHHAARRRVSPGGQEAVTVIIGREVLKAGTVLKVQLETGRTHQIRVHLSHMGHPLYGDGLYGGPSWNAGQGRPSDDRSGTVSGFGAAGAEFRPEGSSPSKSGLPESSSAASRHPGSGPAGLYGSSSAQPALPRSRGRQALHGESLAFSHPWTRERLEVADPWPEDMLRLLALLGGV